MFGSRRFFEELAKLPPPLASSATVILADGTRHSSVPICKDVTVTLGSDKNVYMFTSDFYLLDLPDL